MINYERCHSGENCPGCGVVLGQPHDHDCDVQRCTACGGQRVRCRCEGHDPLASAWTGAWPPSPRGSSYHVVEQDFDTRVHECDDGSGEFESFEEAKHSAVEYLEELISRCELTLEEIQRAG